MIDASAVNAALNNLQIPEIELDGLQGFDAPLGLGID